MLGHRPNPPVFSCTEFAQELSQDCPSGDGQFPAGGLGAGALANDYASEHLNARASNDYPPKVVLVVVVGTSLVSVGPAAVFLGLPGG